MGAMPMRRLPGRTQLAVFVIAALAWGSARDCRAATRCAVEVRTDGTIEVLATVVGEAVWSGTAGGTPHDFVPSPQCAPPRARCRLGPDGSLAARRRPRPAPCTSVTTAA
jgi:hypothetical protein